MRFIGYIALSLALMFVTYGSAANSSDTIKITNLYSSEPVTRGVENEITVEVEYNLETGEEGEINLGFNTDKPNAFRMVDSRIVQRGSGSATLKAKVVPVDWGQRARFMALVNLSKHPHEARWRTLASDRKEIPVGH